MSYNTYYVYMMARKYHYISYGALQTWLNGHYDNPTDANPKKTKAHGVYTNGWRQIVTSPP
jgi:hypothetical protein